MAALTRHAEAIVRGFRRPIIKRPASFFNIHFTPSRDGTVLRWHLHSLAVNASRNKMRGPRPQPALSPALTRKTTPGLPRDWGRDCGTSACPRTEAPSPHPRPVSFEPFARESGGGHSFWGGPGLSSIPLPRVQCDRPAGSRPELFAGLLEMQKRLLRDEHATTLTTMAALAVTYT